MTYDSVRSVVLMFGGINGATRLGDVWTWDGSAWQIASLGGGPSPRAGAAMAFDRHRGVTVLYGGNTGIPESQTWEWLGFAWTTSSTPALISRSSHAMVYDGLHTQLVMHSGLAGAVLFTHPTDDTLVTETATTEAYGTSCGVPPLTALPATGSRPFLGSTQLTDVTGVPTTAAAIAIGFSRTIIGLFALPIPLDGFGMTGCWLNHDAGYSGLLPCPPAVAGATRHSLPIPAAPALNGARVYLQALALAPGVNPFGLITSNGVELRLAP